MSSGRRASGDLLVVCAVGGCCEVHDLGVGKSAEDFFPALGRAVVAFVNEDKVEEEIFEVRKPAIGAAGELLDIGQHDVRLLAVVDVRVLAVENCNVRAGQHRLRRQNGALSPEAAAPVGDIEIGVQAVPDRDVGGNHEHAAMGEAEGEECDQARLSTPDRQLKDRGLATGAEVFESCGVGLALGVP